MRVPAEHFLTLRAFGAPPIVIALAAQGTFRGFMDTKTPLYAIGKLQYVSSLSFSLSLSPSLLLGVRIYKCMNEQCCDLQL
jgi:Na+-driven multidrug efflux pump